MFWGKQTGLTVAPARPPLPAPPTHLPQRPAHAPGACYGVSAASVLGPRLPAGGQKAAQRPWAAGGGAGASATRGHSSASAPPGPAQGGPSGGGGPPAAATPTTRPLDGALTQRVVLFEHPLHGDGGEGMQPALGAAELSEPTTTTTTAAAAAATTRQAGLPAAGA